MGKYDKLAFDAQYKLEHGPEIAIANELAEANRLKRLELWYKLHPSPDMSEYSIEQDLKDKA